MSDPRDLVWYLECRIFKTKADGAPDYAPEEAASMGSGVAVKLKSPDGEVRKYLLTCGHVVRRKANAADKEGWGSRFEEIYCFPHNQAYAPTGERTRLSGTHQRGMLADLHQLTPFGASVVPEPDRQETNDWALLEVRDPKFQNFPAVELWGTVTANVSLQITGYPGGAGSKAAPSWPTGIVQAFTSAGFSQNRLPAQGMLKLEGAAETQRGMSGGAVFTYVTPELVGLHRGTDDSILARQSISIQHIRERLGDAGFAPYVGPGDIARPPGEPWDDLLVCQDPVIPFINRVKLRGHLKKISVPGSGYLGITLIGPSGSGKSWSGHLVKHGAKAKGMRMAILNLGVGQSISMACRRVTRDLGLDPQEMVKRVLEDQAADSTLGQKFAYWLVEATRLPNIGAARSIVMVDQIHTSDGARSPLFEDLIMPLIEELKGISSSPGLALILAGDSFPADPAQQIFVLDEMVDRLTAQDVSDFITAYVKGKNRTLSPTEHAQVLLTITGGATGPFDPAKMRDVMMAMTLILENRVI